MGARCSDPPHGSSAPREHTANVFLEVPSSNSFDLGADGRQVLRPSTWQIQPHEHTANVFLEDPSSNSFDLA